MKIAVAIYLMVSFLPSHSGADTDLAGPVKCMQKVVEAMPREVRDKDGPFLFIPPGKGSPTEGMSSAPTVVAYYNANGSGSIKVIKALGTISVVNDPQTLACNISRTAPSDGSSALARQFLAKYFSDKPSWYAPGRDADRKNWDRAVQDCRKLYPSHPAFQSQQGTGISPGTAQ